MLSFPSFFPKNYPLRSSLWSAAKRLKNENNPKFYEPVATNHSIITAVVTFQQDGAP